MLEKIALNLVEQKSDYVWEVYLSYGERFIEFDYEYFGSNSKPSKVEILSDLVLNHDSVVLSNSVVEVNSYEDWLEAYELEDIRENRIIYNYYIDNAERLKHLFGNDLSLVCEELGL